MRKDTFKSLVNILFRFSNTTALAITRSPITTTMSGKIVPKKGNLVNS